MDIITVDQLAAMSRRPVNANMRSIALVVNDYGRRFGLDYLHRLAQFLAQLMHESGDFRYDREIWGPTPAQIRYDTRTDLGNTPAVDGDGERNAGRGPIQVTGGDNLRALTKWARKNFPELAPPDFFANPDIINTDPWEGISALWYWSTRKLNALADENDIEQITKKINGGRNGLADRLANYEDAALVLLGYQPGQVLAFQTWAKQRGFYTGEIDGDSGPKTRAAMHMALYSKSGKANSPLTIDGTAKEVVKAAPVIAEVEIEKEVAVVPEAATKRGIPWLVGGLGFLTAPVTWFFDLDRGSQIILGTAVGFLFVLLLLRGEFIIRRIKTLVAEIG